MLSDKMLDKLNEQINVEFYSSNLYLQMSSWCESQGLEGCATFLQAHATEEMEHMQRLFTYVNECGALAKIGAIVAIPEIVELNIGHSIVSRAVFDGLSVAVSEMKRLMLDARAGA